MPKISKIPYVFFVFFAVIFVANGILIYAALESWTGLESKNTYIKSPKFNTILKERTRLIALGWTFEISAQKTETGSMLFTAKVLDKYSHPIFGRVQLDLLRPTTAKYDKHVPMQKNGPAYTAKSTLPLPGQWDVKVTIKARGEVVSAQKRFFLP